MTDLAIVYLKQKLFLILLAFSTALWLLFKWLPLGWLIFRWLLFGWLLLRWLLLEWLLLRWLLLTFNLNKTPLGETGCLPYFLLTGCSSIQFFDSPPPQHSQSAYLWLPNSHWAALVWFTAHYAIPLVIKCFLPNLYLGKQRISLGVASIFYTCASAHIPSLIATKY